MVRAVAGGLVDYSGINPFSLRDAIHERTLLSELQRRELLQYLEQCQLRRLLLLLAPLTDEARERNYEEAFQLWSDYHDALMYRKIEDKKVKQQRFGRDMTAAWEREFGDLQDSSTQQHIDAVATWMQQRRKAAPKDGRLR
jgi:hypothetical protein